MCCGRFPRFLNSRAYPEAPSRGYEGGYGYLVAPYGTAYRSALRNTRTRTVGFRTAGERGGDNLKAFEDFHLHMAYAKARVWS